MSSAFKALSLGVGSFDKNRFQSQVDLFNRREKETARDDAGGGSRRGGSPAAAASALPAELDFFGQSKSDDKGKKKARGGEDGSNGDEEIAAALSKSAKKRKRGVEEHDDTSPLTPSTLKSYLKQHRLNMTGTDCPMPVVSWSECAKRYQTPSWLIDELATSRKWSLSGVQRAALPVAFQKRDLLAMAPTGSGKTMAYLLPMVHRLLSADRSKAKHGPRALILSPTRELATQIYNEARRLLSASPDKKTLRVALLTGKERLVADEKDKIPGGKGAKFDLLISTPLRLVNAVEVEGWDLGNVSQVVLDEGDTLLSEAFLKQTDQILSLCTSASLQKSLFSATLPSSIETLSKTFLSPDHVRLIVGSSNSSSSDVFQEVKFTGSEEGKLMELRSMIKMGGLKPPALLFVQSIERAKDLYEELIYDGLRIDVIHSDRNRRERESVISSFKRGEVWLLICTEVLSRGLDFKGVELVINYDFPTSVESYIHRIGRTGRAGRQGSAVTFFTKEDAPYLRSVMNLIKASNPDAVARLPEYLLQLPKSSKKEKKKLKRTTVQRQGVAEASGSRKAEVDARERKEGRRVSAKKSRATMGDSDEDGDSSDGE